jgi:hypothetical protein
MLKMSGLGFVPTAVLFPSREILGGGFVSGFSERGIDDRFYIYEKLTRKAQKRCFNVL